MSSLKRPRGRIILYHNISGNQQTGFWFAFGEAIYYQIKQQKTLITVYGLYQKHSKKCTFIWCRGWCKGTCQIISWYVALHHSKTLPEPMLTKLAIAYIYFIWLQWINVHTWQISNIIFMAMTSWIIQTLGPCSFIRMPSNMQNCYWKQAWIQLYILY